MLSARRRYAKGQGDHVDAWLISYADLITLLFMLFVILVSVSMAQRETSAALGRGEPPHPYVREDSGLLRLVTPYDDAYRDLTGIVVTSSADQSIAVEKMRDGLWIDMASEQFFKPHSADLAEEQLPLLRRLVHSLISHDHAKDAIEVAGYTDDEATGGAFATNWELSAMRAARVVGLLIDEGIDPSRLRAVGYAANHPVVPNSDVAGRPIPENRRRNQRIVIRVEAPPVPQTRSFTLF